MNKQEYLAALRQGLSGLPIDDGEERLNFYSEMIDDRMEEGKSEEQVVAELDSVEDVVSQILSDIPVSKLVKKKIKSGRRLRTWEIVLLALGFPIWFSLGIAALAVILTLFAVLWSVLISAWAVFGACVGAVVGGVGGGILFVCQGYLSSGLVLIFSALVSAGLSIFLFFGCRKATVGTAKLTKRIVLGIKKMFVRGEATA